MASLTVWKEEVKDIIENGRELNFNENGVFHRIEAIRNEDTRDQLLQSLKSANFVEAGVWIYDNAYLFADGMGLCFTQLLLNVQETEDLTGLPSQTTVEPLQERVRVPADAVFECGMQNCQNVDKDTDQAVELPVFGVEVPEAVPAPDDMTMAIRGLGMRLSKIHDMKAN
jgi:hypothetical protein